MYKALSSSVTTADRPVSTWVGQRIRDNTIALTERGPSGGFAWSSSLTIDGATLIQAQPSPISTHPDHWYSVPFIFYLPPFQARVSVDFTIAVTGAGVRVRLWCEGNTSNIAPAITTSGSYTRSVDIPPLPIGTDLRCALIFQSVSEDEPTWTGNLTRANNLTVGIDGTTYDPGEFEMSHVFMELTPDTADPSDLPSTGWYGATRFHLLRAGARDK